MSQKVFGTDGEKVIFADRNEFKREAAEAKAWRDLKEKFLSDCSYQEFEDYLALEIARLDSLFYFPELKR